MATVNELLHRRFGVADDPNDVALNETLTSILSHRSIRKYRLGAMPIWVVK